MNPLITFEDRTGTNSAVSEPGHPRWVLEPAANLHIHLLRFGARLA